MRGIEFNVDSLAPLTPLPPPLPLVTPIVWWKFTLCNNQLTQLVDCIARHSVHTVQHEMGRRYSFSCFQFFSTPNQFFFDTSSVCACVHKSTCLPQVQCATLPVWWCLKSWNFLCTQIVSLKWINPLCYSSRFISKPIFHFTFLNHGLAQRESLIIGYKKWWCVKIRHLSGWSDTFLCEFIRIISPAQAINDLCTSKFQSVGDGTELRHSKNSVLNVIISIL